MKPSPTPGIAELLNSAVAAQRSGQLALAESQLRRALAIAPESIDVLVALGDFLRRQQRHAEAQRWLESAAQGAPGNASAIGNLALLRIEQQRYREALALARAAIAADPGNARWWNAAGIAARRSQDPEDAAVFLRRACEIAPANAATWFELAQALEHIGDTGARDAIARARQLAPTWERLRWLQLLQLPAILDDAKQAQPAVQSFANGLDEIERSLKLSTPHEIAAAVDAVVGVLTFTLHYLAGDHSALQRRFGDLVERVIAAAAPALCAPVTWKPLAHRGRLRVGFVSAYLQVHSIARFFSRWIIDLDRTHFESFVWHSGAGADDWTREIAQAADHFVQASDNLGEKIRAAELDALIFLDIGLDPRQQALAAMRLAPLQCVTFGHPVTSGLKTLDAFISAQGLETPASQDQYSEPLIELPGLGIAIHRRDADIDSRSADDREPDRRPELLCLQNLIKLQPDFDDVLARVVQATGARLTLFDISRTQTALFRSRLRRAFDARGLDFDSAVQFVPKLAHAEFLATIRDATLVLDSPGFSGGATSIDAISVGTPIVTFAGATARARQTGALLRVVAADELIVGTFDEYVALTTALCADHGRRSELRARLLRNSARLYECPDVQHAFETFLQQSVARIAYP